MAVSKKEQTAAQDRLRTWLKPGDTVHCILRSVSRSGMSRVIDLVKITPGGTSALGYNAALAMDYRFDSDRQGIKISGCGMDMGFELVYQLGHCLWPTGYTCYGEKCRSNDHTNGDRNYKPHLHKDPGYALRHNRL